MHDPSDPFIAHQDRCPSAATDQPLARFSWAGDGLTEALVRFSAAALEQALETQHDERFLQWIAEEERRRVGLDGQLPGRRHQSEQLARRIHAAVAARQLRVRCQTGGPELRDAHGWPGSSGETSTGTVVRRRTAPKVDLGVAAGVGRELWDEPCDSWIDLPPDVAPGAYIGLGVKGDSMEPLMHTGDTILVRIGGDLQSDTVVVARHPENGYVVKRLARLTSTTVHLTSLNDAYPALALPRDPALIVGTVIMRWCAHGEDASSSGTCPTLPSRG